MTIARTMTTLQLAQDAVRAMDEAERKYADGDLSQGAKDNIILEAADDLRAHVRSLPEPGEAVVHGLRRKGTTAIIGIIPNKIAAKPATASKWMDDFEEIPLFAAPVVSEDARNAARYRYLRDVAWHDHDNTVLQEPNQHLDAAIDTAMQENT